MSFYSGEELKTLGLKKYGENVNISRFCRLYNPGSMEIGSNVRIDDFCLLSASSSNPFIIEDYVHISAGTYIFGTAGFHIKSFSNISVGCKVFTVSDTFSGEYLIGPSVPMKYRKVIESALTIERHTVIGAGCTVLPGFTIGEGVAIGANSLVNKNCESWSIYAGSPIRRLKDRSKKLLEMENFANV